MLAIKNNLMADSAARHLGTSYEALAKSVERLSSGLRINSAKDDAAGLAVRELIRADVAALRQGSRNAQDAVSMLQSAEGGLTVIDDILVRMRELAEQAATGSYSSTQVTIMQSEFDELAAEITRIASNTEFNENKLLDTTAVGAFEIALGGGLVAGQTIKLDSHDMTATTLGVGGAVEIASGRGVGATTATYFTGDGAADDLTFTFDATEAATITVGNGSKTLAEVVTELNQSSRAAVAGWDVATAAYNSDTGQYVLKLSHHTAGNVTFAVTNVGAPIWATALGGDAVATGGFV
ncbi:MAG: flagellin, partial [Phycisphaerae bacterium]